MLLSNVCFFLLLDFIVLVINQFANSIPQEAASIDKSKLDPASAAQIPVIQLKDCILLAACAANETLPTNPDLPADLFTSCLTTPIKAALRWCVEIY